MRSPALARRLFATATTALVVAACAQDRAGESASTASIDTNSNESSLSSGRLQVAVGKVAGIAARSPASAPPAIERQAADADGLSGTAANAAEPPFSQISDTYRTAGATIVPTMVIRTGQATLEVQTLDPAMARIRQLASQLGGYVGNTTLQGGKDQPRSAMIELKVPAEQFDRAVSGLSPIGKVETVNVTAEDVGEEYVDISARVTNAHRLESRLVDLLTNRTAKLGDMLTVERELARVREEIERYEGRLRFLKTRAAVSSLAINIHEPFPILGDRNAPNPLAEALRQAWRNFVALLAGFIASLGVLIPLGALVFVAWVIGRRFLPKLPPKTGEATT
jgi:hypothetical protein